MLVQVAIRLAVERIGSRVVDHLREIQHLTGGVDAVLFLGQVAEHHVVNGVVDGVHVDGAGESHADARRGLETIELIDQLDILAIAGGRGAIGHRQVDADAVLLGAIGRGQSVGRVRAYGGVLRIPTHRHAAGWQQRREQRQRCQGEQNCAHHKVRIQHGWKADFSPRGQDWPPSKAMLRKWTHYPDFSPARSKSETVPVYRFPGAAGRATFWYPHFPWPRACFP